MSTAIAHEPIEDKLTLSPAGLFLVFEEYILHWCALFRVLSLGSSEGASLTRNFLINNLFESENKTNLEPPPIDVRENQFSFLSSG